MPGFSFPPSKMDREVLVEVEVMVRTITAVSGKRAGGDIIYYRTRWQHVHRLDRMRMLMRGR